VPLGDLPEETRAVTVTAHWRRHARSLSLLSHCGPGPPGRVENLGPQPAARPSHSDSKLGVTAAEARAATPARPVGLGRRDDAGRAQRLAGGLRHGHRDWQPPEARGGAGWPGVVPVHSAIPGLPLVVKFLPGPHQGSGSACGRPGGKSPRPDRRAAAPPSLDRHGPQPSRHEPRPHLRPPRARRPRSTAPPPLARLRHAVRCHEGRRPHLRAVRRVGKPLPGDCPRPFDLRGARPSAGRRRAGARLTASAVALARPRGDVPTRLPPTAE
jgi:hypothetical protein